jgi:hypothetical protein
MTSISWIKKRKKNIITEEFEFNNLINETTPNELGKRVIGLVARISGLYD